LPKEQYWDISDTEEIKLALIDATEFQDKYEAEIQKASKVNSEIQDIKSNLDKGKKEINAIALGLCQWKNDLLWY